MSVAATEVGAAEGDWDSVIGEEAVFDAVDIGEDDIISDRFAWNAIATQIIRPICSGICLIVIHFYIDSGNWMTVGVGDIALEDERSVWSPIFFNLLAGAIDAKDCGK